jgi:hypothetical protein
VVTHLKLVRIDQACFGRSGGLAPVSLPLFQGIRLGRRQPARQLMTQSGHAAVNCGGPAILRTLLRGTVHWPLNLV